MKYTIRGLCLAVLGIASVFALGTGSASAATQLLFEPTSGKFPYHAVGLTVGSSVLETVGGKKTTSTAVHVLALVQSRTLIHIHILFLGVQAEAGSLSPCGLTSTETSTEHVLILILAHFGLADPGSRHAILGEVPTGFAFFCHNPLNGTNEEIKVRGNVIGLVTKPAAGVESEELGIQFKQEKGKQNFTEFLLPSLMTSQFLESSAGGGAFEQAGESTPEVVLKALAGEGKAKLVLE